MKVILLRFGELFLKGANRKVFERALVKNIKDKLSGLDYSFQETFGRYVISKFREEDLDELVDKLKTVFGLHSLSIAEELEATPEAIRQFVSKINIGKKTFKVSFQTNGGSEILSQKMGRI